MNESYCLHCMNPLRGEEDICPVCGTPVGIADREPPKPHHLPPGTILTGRYLVGRVLGEGGFGITYLGLDLRLNLKVAIKEFFLMNHAARNPSVGLQVLRYSGSCADAFELGKQKFLGEAHILAKMSKMKEIVGVRDYFEENETAYIVMEYIEGTTLEQQVRERGGRIPPEELFAEVEPLFRALDAVHAQGLIHRDIAPDNLMLENGSIRLLDFGCARETGNERVTIILKPGFAPLEQYLGTGQGPWTDVYALCATLYYCLTGTTPPLATSRLKDDPLVAPRSLGVALSPQQEEALLWGMAVAPEERCQSAQDLHDALYAAPGAGPLAESVEQAPETPELPRTQQPEDVSPKEEALVGKTELPSGTDAPVASDSSVPEAPAQPAQPEKKPFPLPKNRAPIAAGLALLLAAGLWFGRSPATPPGGDSSGAASSGAVSTGGGSGGTGTGPELGILTPPKLQNEVTLTNSDRPEEELMALMADESVTSVVVPSGLSLYLETLDVTKPITVEQGALLFAQCLTVESSGALRNNGTVSAELLLHLKGSSAEVYQHGSGATLELDDGICLWAGSQEVLNALPGLDTSTSQVLFDEDAALEQGTKVSSEAEFLAAAKAGFDLVVQGDVVLHLTEDLSAPNVIVPEGSSLTGLEQGSGTLCWSEGHVLCNRGRVSGAWDVKDGGLLFNEGSLDCVPREKGGSLWMGGHSLLLNAGSASLDGSSQLYHSALSNLPGGELTLRSTRLFRSSRLCNAGTVQVALSEYGYSGGLQLRSGSFLRNEAEMTVLTGSTLLNSGAAAENLGTLSFQDQSTFYNDRLINQGSLTGSGVNMSGAGIIWGNGTVDLNGGSVPNLALSESVYDNAASASTAEELVALLKDQSASAVTIPAGADVTVDEKTVRIKQPLLVEGSLSFAPGTTCYIEGSQLTVAPGGRLSVYCAGVTDGSCLCLNGTMEVHAAQDETGWEFYIWDSAVVGRTGAMIFDNQNGYADAETGLSRSVVAPPSVDVRGWGKFSVSDKTVFMADDLNLPQGNGEFYISEDSALCLNGEQCILRNMHMYGALLSSCDSLTIGGDDVSVGGTLAVTGGDLLLDGDVENHGSIVMDESFDFTLEQRSGHLKNRGTIKMGHCSANLNDVDNSGTITDRDGVEHTGTWP